MGFDLEILLIKKQLNFIVMISASFESSKHLHCSFKFDNLKIWTLSYMYFKQVTYNKRMVTNNALGNEIRIM